MNENRIKNKLSLINIEYSINKYAVAVNKTNFTLKEYNNFVSAEISLYQRIFFKLSPPYFYIISQKIC